MAILSMANVVVMIRVLVMLYAHGHAESQIRRCRGGIATQKFFACPESFCAYIQNGPKIKSKHSISLESFWTVWKVSEQSEKFPYSLKSFWTVWKVLGE